MADIGRTWPPPGEPEGTPLQTGEPLGGLVGQAQRRNRSGLGRAACGQRPGAGGHPDFSIRKGR